MLKIFNQSHEAVGYIKKYRDCKIESVLSTAEKTLSFTYLGKAGKIDYEYYVQTKDAEYVVKSIRITSDGYPEYTATLNMEELESKTWETFLAKDSSLIDTANLALAGTGWRVAECTVDKRRSMGLQNVTSKVVLQKICTVFMCEMQVDSKEKTVSFKEKFGEDKGVYFLQGLNLRKLTLSGDTYDFYTRIIPVGKDGLKITAVNSGKEYIDNFQYSKKIIPYIWQDTSYEDATALMEDATEKLKDLSIPKKSYTVDVRDLAYRSAEYSILEYNLGDTITLIDRKTGIRDTQRITKIVEYPVDPDKNTCDIANTRETFDEIQSRLKEAASIIEAVKNLDGSINGNTVDKVTTDQILGFKDGVESGIQNSGTISEINGEIAATKAQIGTIENTYLKTTEAEIKFATIDLANIKNASIKTAMIDVGAINTAQIADASITDAKIVELTANKITAGTLSVERLEIRGSNRSIVYALNNITGALQSQNVDTLNGEILTQRTITADKIVAQSITGNEIAAKTILANHIDVVDLFAQKIEAADLHITGNSTVDGNLITSGINAEKITTGILSTDRLDINSIFAQEITATGTITGAFLKGSRLITADGEKGSVDIAGDTIYAKYSYASNKTQEMSLCADWIAFGETVKNGNSASTYSYVSLDQNGLYIQDIVHLSRSAAQATFSCNVVTTGLGVHGSADINNDLRVYGSLRADGNITTSTIELYAATPFIDFHFDGNSADYTSRIIELESGKLNVNGVVCNSGGIWGTNIAIDGPGTFTRGITSKTESIFHTGSYTDPYPGKVCTIKSWGTVASLRFAAKGVSNTWLGAAKPDGAAYDTICTDADALVPGWRVRTADGAWVGASYAQDPGFRIYYCTASRLAGSTNGTDAIYTFGASGTFHAKSVSQTSDEREKNILSGITEKYEKLFMQLKPVLFNWKNGADGVHIGFGAQTTLDLAEKCGIGASELAAVHKSETEEPWSMSYTEIVPLAVQMTQKAIREVKNIKNTFFENKQIAIENKAKIETLQEQIKQLYVYISEIQTGVQERG